MKSSVSLFRGLTARTPIIIQTEAAECGLACLAMIAGHHGHRTDLAGLRRRFAASLKGLTMRDLVAIGGKLNLATRALRLDLADMAKLKLPCLLHWDHNHFVVLTKVGASHITIHDPALGRRKIPMEEVSKRFTGVALEAWPTDKFEAKDEQERVRITGLLRRTTGLAGAASKVIAISILLEVVVITMPIAFQLVVDEAVVTSDLDLLTLIAVIMAFLLALQAAATMLRSWVTMLVSSSLIVQWSTSLFDHLMRLPLSFFEKRHVGDVISRFGSLDAVRETLTTKSIMALLDGVMSIALVVMMWLYAGPLFLVPVGAVTIYAVMRFIAYHRYRSLSEEAIIHQAQEETHLIETVRGVASMKALNLEQRRRESWINHLVDRVSAQLNIQKFDIVFSAASQSILGFSRILIIYLAVRAVFANEMSVGMVLAFLAYNDQFAGRIDSFINTALQLKMLSLHSERIADIALADPEEPARDLRAARLTAERAHQEASTIVVDAVSYRYADNEPDVLADVNITIEAGECVGIAGPSGCGKTTLLKILAGLATPTQGQILIDGVPVSSLGLDSYRSRVACVLQDDRLFAGSIADNIAGFDAAPDPAWIQECAMMAAIHLEIAKMPMGYDTLVGDMGSTLSGGQMQRVVLARALYRRPSVLFLDEATSHLDEANESAINIAIKRLSVTRVIVAHRKSTLAMTDRVIELKSLQAARLAAMMPQIPKAPQMAATPANTSDAAPAPAAAPTYGASQSNQTWSATAKIAANSGS